MMLYLLTNNTLDMSSPPTHSPAIILSGIDDDGDDGDDHDRDGPKQLVPAAVAAPAVRLRLLASLPASSNPQERQLASFLHLATTVPIARVPETLGVGTKDVDPAEVFEGE